MELKINTKILKQLRNKIDILSCCIIIVRHPPWERSQNIVALSLNTLLYPRNVSTMCRQNRGKINNFQLRLIDSAPKTSSCYNQFEGDHLITKPNKYNDDSMSIFGVRSKQICQRLLKKCIDAENNNFEASWYTKLNFMSIHLTYLVLFFT